MADFLCMILRFTLNVWFYGVFFTLCCAHYFFITGELQYDIKLSFALFVMFICLFIWFYIMEWDN